MNWKKDIKKKMNIYKFLREGIDEWLDEIEDREDEKTLTEIYDYVASKV